MTGKTRASRLRRFDQRNTIIFLVIFAIFAVGATILFRHKMVIATVFSNGEHAEEEVFFGGVAEYPDAASLGWGIYIAGILFLAVCGLWIANTKASVEKIFLWIAIPLGIIYMVMMVPNAVPDEFLHYQSSYKLSNALLFRWNQMDEGASAHFDYHNLRTHFNPASGYDRILREFFLPIADGSEQAIPLTKIDFPLMYLPQAVGITIGRILGLGFLPVFYLGRLTNLLFYVFVVYHAICKMPRYQLLLCMIALLPMNIHQAASYSYDAYVHGFSLLVIALICHMAWLPSQTTARKRISVEWKFNPWKGVKEALTSGIGEAGTISRREMWELGIVILLWAPTKPVYVPLLLLLLLVPKEKFGSQGRKILWCVVLILLALMITIVFRISDIPGTKAFETNTNVVDLGWGDQEKYTLGWIFQHPIDMIKMMLRTLRMNYLGWLYECMGSSLAGLSVLVPRRNMNVYLILLLLCSLRRTENATEDHSPASLDNELFRLNLWHRMILLAVGFIIICLMFYTFALSWTHLGSDVIEGIQGRYFIPVFISPFLLLDNSLLVLHRNPKRVILIGGLMMHVATIMDVIRITMMM